MPSRPRSHGPAVLRARTLRWAGGTRPWCPVCRGAPTLLPPSTWRLPGSSLSLWLRLGAGGAGRAGGRAGWQGWVPWLLPSPAWAALSFPWGAHQSQSPSPLAQGRDSAAAGGCRGPGCCRGGTPGGRGSLRQAPLSQAPTAASPGAGAESAAAPLPAGWCPPPPAPVPTLQGHPSASAGSHIRGKPAGSRALPSQSCCLCAGHGGGLAGASMVPEGVRAQHACPSEPHGVV